MYRKVTHLKLRPHFLGGSESTRCFICSEAFNSTYKLTAFSTVFFYTERRIRHILHCWSMMWCNHHPHSFGGRYCGNDSSSNPWDIISPGHNIHHIYKWKLKMITMLLYYWKYWIVSMFYGFLMSRVWVAWVAINTIAHIVVIKMYNPIAIY